MLRHLEPTGIYQFRVIGKNGFGWGDPSLASRIIRTHPKGKFNASTKSPKKATNAGAPKLQLDALRREYRLCVVSLPAESKSAPNGTRRILTGIAEECEEEEEVRIPLPQIELFALFQEAVATSTVAEPTEHSSHNITISGEVRSLSTDDPWKRYRLNEEIFRCAYVKAS